MSASGHRRQPGVAGWRGLPAAVVAALAIAGCGGGGGAPSPATGERPVVEIIAPADLADGLLGLQVMRAEAPGAAAVEFELDGESLGPADPAPPFEAGFDAAALAAGQHRLRARALDAAGRPGPWAAVTVRVGGERRIGAGFEQVDDWLVGLDAATAFAQAPDGRLFIAEQGGRLRVVRDGVLLAQPFVQLAVDARGERGLIGVALHPQFATNGWVYLHYTTTADGGAHNRISRLVADGDRAAGAETVLVELPPLSSATNHNGGAMHFGADGKLYVGVGENADPQRAQDPADPFGKLLRFDDDGAIPADNPFCGRPGALACAVWARGLRNPFTFAVQPGSGRLHINDVGAGLWEEVNLGVAGANYGWPDSEGPDGVGAGVRAPLFAYPHTPATPPGAGPGGFLAGLAITGAAFYPDAGPFPPSHHGNYFFADLVAGFVARLDPSRDAAVVAFTRVAGAPVGLLVGRDDGALYVLQRDRVTRIGRQ